MVFLLVFVYAYLCVCVLLFPKLLLLVPFSTPGSPGSPGYMCLSKPAVLGTLPGRRCCAKLPPVGSSCVLLIFPTALHPKWNIQPTSRFAGRVREKTHAADFQSAAVVFDQSSIWIPAVASVLPSSSWQLELEFSLQNSGATGQLFPVGTMVLPVLLFIVQIQGTNAQLRNLRDEVQILKEEKACCRTEDLRGSRTQNVSKLAWPMMIQYI